MNIGPNILASIGNTPLVQLQKVVPPGSARVLAKLEWANPTGSMKDRMAQAAIEHAEADGRLRPGGTVVEYTAGTTDTRSGWPSDVGPEISSGRRDPLAHTSDRSLADSSTSRRPSQPYLQGWENLEATGFVTKSDMLKTLYPL